MSIEMAVFVFLGLSTLSNLLVTVALSLYTTHRVQKIAQAERELLNAEINQNREAVVNAMLEKASTSGQNFN